jgi:hypothetical protein
MLRAPLPGRRPSALSLPLQRRCCVDVRKWHLADRDDLNDADSQANNMVSAFRL